MPTTTPIKPPPIGKDDRLDEELHGDVAALGAERAADADLAGALRDGGEHDVHDADAADEQRDGGDGAQHDVEDALGLFGLAQELQRDDRLRSRSSRETGQQAS